MTLGRQAFLVGALCWLPTIGGSLSGQAPPPRPEGLLLREVSFEAPLEQATERRLSNGVRLVIVEDDTLPLFDLAAALPVGEILDDPQSLGVAATVGALLRRGGAGNRSADAFDRAIDRAGFSASSVGGFRRSGVTLGGLSERLSEGVSLFVSMLTAPRFEEAEVRRFRDGLRRSLERRGDSPSGALDREWRWLMHGEEGLAARQLRPADLERLDRAALLDFHRRCYRPEQTVIAVSGAVSADDVVQRFEEALGAWTASGDCKAVAGLELSPAKPGLRVLDAPLRQAQIVLGHAGARRVSWDDRESWALLVLDEVLAGSGAVSRLGSRLRAREGLVYQVQATFGIGSRDEGLFEIVCVTDPPRVGRVVDLIVEELRRLQSQQVPALELDLAQRSLLDSLPLLFETSEAIAGRLAEDLLLDRPHSYWSLYAERIRAVTAADVQRVAQRFLSPGQLRGIVVGSAGPILESLQSSTSQQTPAVVLPGRDPLTLKRLE